MSHNLNPVNDITRRIIHIMVTDKCDRKCPYCCNLQYDIEKDVPIVTDDELRHAEYIFLTGGEPFAYADPCAIAAELKTKYPHLKGVFVYTNALELSMYLANAKLHSIDGLTISVKNKTDKTAFETIVSTNEDVLALSSNRLYVFDGFEDTVCPDCMDKRLRHWQANFVPAPDSIFRRF